MDNCRAVGFGPSEQAPGFRPTTLPPTCRAAATLCDFLPRVLRLDISVKEIAENLCCEVSAMMVMKLSASSGQTKKKNQVPRTRLVRLPITGVHPRWSHHRLGAGVGPKELRSLPLSSPVSFRESPLHFPYLSGCRVDPSDLARTIRS